MGHKERLERLKENLMCCVEAQMKDLSEVDAEELGEAIDMLKDLEEAIYFHTITEAMKGDSYHHEELREDGTNHYSEPDHHGAEGRSHVSRKSYMEAKHNTQDKAVQLRELEKYMQELSNDIVEMISDSSPEEKSYLEKKMTTLAMKISQMK